MNPLILAQEIIDGRRITREDDLSYFLTCDLDQLCRGADEIRANASTSISKRSSSKIALLLSSKKSGHQAFLAAGRRSAPSTGCNRLTTMAARMLRAMSPGMARMQQYRIRGHRPMGEAMT